MIRENSHKKILIVEDDELFQQALRDYLSDCYSVVVMSSGDGAMVSLNTEPIDLVLLDITLPGEDGISVLKNIRIRWPDIPVIMLTAIDRIATVVECVRLGAIDYLTKPLIAEELLTSIQRAMESIEIRKELDQRRKLQLAENNEFRLLGNSAFLEKVRKQIQVVGKSDSPVLIVGETGTGKELAAREIHACSPRAGKPFVAINCGAIPKDLFETEFFGYKKGAFTGAQSSETGKLQLANGGTLLLDEISELPLDTQTKLLRVLEEHEFYPVGSTQLIRIDVRVIACTNRSLDEMVRQKLFREDLFFRLNVYAIEIPPLKDRPEDLLFLARHFMDIFNRKFAKEFRSIAPEAEQAMLAYAWKGNVRELRNVMERVILSEEDECIRPEHLFSIPGFNAAQPSDSFLDLPESGVDLEQIERDLILQALRKANGNKTKAAKLLNLTAPTFYYRLDKYGIS